MKALLDGDIYAFRPASSAENDDVGIAIWRMEEMIDNTLAAVGADEFSIFLSGDNNFRYEIYPEYKANRTAPKPRHLKALKQYLVEKYNAQVSDGCEADDLLGIEQCSALERRFWEAPLLEEGKPARYVSDTIICSLDKDLRMIPGNHYSFEISGVSNNGNRWVRPEQRIFVEPFDGLRTFYTQVLTGDTTDNIKGAAGIGKVKAERILAEATTESDLLSAVRGYFSCDEELEITGQCLWIFRKPNDRWRIPTFETPIS
jgi:5'-3' exonuclease